MDYNSYKKYFLPHNNLWQIIGGIITVCGIPFFFFRGFGSMMAIVIIAVGLCVFVFAKGNRPSDSEIDMAAAKKSENIEENARRGIDIREKLIKAFPPVSFSDYEFSGKNGDEGEFMVQKGSDGKYRSNRYYSAVILFAQEKLHIYEYAFSMTEPYEKENYFASLYTDLKEAKLEHRESSFVINKGAKSEKEVKLEHNAITVYNNDGEKVIDMPVKDDADVDKTVENINRLITGKKEGTASFN